MKNRCEHCLNYHIPAGQYPCRECECLRIDLRPPE
nr:MAG TPA: UDP zinc-binding RING-finger protein [Caudoviricetes sp.]